MIYLAVFGALVCSFLGGFTAQWLFLRLNQPDQCQPALDQLAEQLKMVQSVAPNRKPFDLDHKKEVRKPVMRKWSEDMPAKDAN